MLLISKFYLKKYNEFFVARVRKYTNLLQLPSCLLIIRHFMEQPLSSSAGIKPRIINKK